MGKFLCLKSREITHAQNQNRKRDSRSFTSVQMFHTHTHSASSGPCDTLNCPDFGSARSPSEATPPSLSWRPRRQGSRATVPGREDSEGIQPERWAEFGYLSVYEIPYRAMPHHVYIDIHSYIPMYMCIYIYIYIHTYTYV